MNVKKLIIALLLLCAAGFTAFWVKDMLDRENPEYAIPKVTVTADGQEIPVTISGYKWNFTFGGVFKKISPSVYDIAQVSVSLKGGESLETLFSQDVKKLNISRSASYSYNFSPTENDMTVPYEKGAYLYDMYAVFDNGSMQCYFYIIVE